MEANHPETLETGAELLARLPALPVDRRIAALETLFHDPSPEIRNRVLHIGSLVLSDDHLAGYLRNDDDGALRNAGLEILKARGERSYPLAVHLLQDADADVVLQAVLILDHLRNPRALEPLRAVLQHPDLNVVEAAITAVGRLGDASWVRELLPFLRADTWLQAAAIQALGDLRSRLAVRPLSRLLNEPGFGPMAAEALARIGGAVAFRALAAACLSPSDELDTEAMLGLLAHVMEGLSRHPGVPQALAGRLREELSNPSAEVRRDAARCLLALGPGPLDDAALDILAAGDPTSSSPLPAVCRRPDLTARLLARRGAAQGWGFFLAARTPHAVSPAELFAAIQSLADPGAYAVPIAQALARVQHPQIGPVLLRHFLRLTPEQRRGSTSLLRQHAGAVRAALETTRGLTATDQLVVSALLGGPPARSTAALQALPPASRAVMLEQLADLRPLMRHLPWEKWLHEAPAEMGPPAAGVACRAGLRELLPSLRRVAREHPAPALVRAFGELRDRESTPLLLDLLAARQDLAPLVLDSLGRIGGPQVRAELRDRIPGRDGADARLLYKALSLCAEAEDAPLFRAVAGHPDWYIRLAAAEALVRCPQAGNRPALALLAADPVPAVAHRALTAITALAELPDLPATTE